MDELDLKNLQRLAGIIPRNNFGGPQQVDSSMSGTQKSEYMREHNIRPGTDAWFKLWFARPNLTGEKPTQG